MSQPRWFRPNNTLSLLSDLFNRKLDHVASQLATGKETTMADLEELERIVKVRDYLAAESARRRKKQDFLALGIFLLFLGSSCFIRLHTVAADIEIDVTSLSLKLAAQAGSTLIPGETGQILALRQIRVSSAETIRPSTLSTNGSFDLEMPHSIETSKINTLERLAVRLQEIVIPTEQPEDVMVRVAYGVGESGVAIILNGSKPVTILMGQVIKLIGQSDRKPSDNNALRPIQAAGKNLALELFPVPNYGELTIFRDVAVSEVRFDRAERSTILNGAVWIKAASSSRVALQPSDRLVLQADGPILLRELLLAKNRLRARLSIPKATALVLEGNPLRNLKPSLFEWIRYRWPAEFYASISALFAAWLAFRSWTGWSGKQ